MRLVPSNMFKPSTDYFTDHSNALLLLWINFVVCVLCVCHNVLPFLGSLWSTAGKELTSLLSCMLCFLVLLSLSHMVSLVRCGI